MVVAHASVVLDSVAAVTPLRVNFIAAVWTADGRSMISAAVKCATFRNLPPASTTQSIYREPHGFVSPLGAESINAWA